jgi:hypothetical protein
VDNARYWWCRWRGMPMVPLWTKEEGINWKKRNIETKYRPLGSNLTKNKRWSKKLDYCCPTLAHILFLLNFYPISWINWNIWKSWISTKEIYGYLCCSFTFHLVRLFFLGIKMLFVVGEKVVRIEHSKVKSKAWVWRLGRNVDG